MKNHGLGVKLVVVVLVLAALTCLLETTTEAHHGWVRHPGSWFTKNPIPGNPTTGSRGTDVFLGMFGGGGNPTPTPSPSKPNQPKCPTGYYRSKGQCTPICRQDQLYNPNARECVSKCDDQHYWNQYSNACIAYCDLDQNYANGQCYCSDPDDTMVDGRCVGDTNE